MFSETVQNLYFHVNTVYKYWQKKTFLRRKTHDMRLGDWFSVYTDC